MNIEQRRQLKQVIDIFLRRKNIIFACLLLGIGIGLVVYLNTPKVYQASAMIKYQRQSVNPTVMSPDDSRTDAKDAVETVSQQIMSRTSLEELIKELDLYKAIRTTLPMEDVVDLMRKEYITTDFLEGGEVFEVSFQGSNPDEVLRVTNALAAKFIEENLRFRQEIASQTSSYIKDELRMAKESLDKKELIMRDYKLQYYNEMPQQLTNNMTRLNALQEQYQNTQESVQELERTRLMVHEQISQMKNFLNRFSPMAAGDYASPGKETKDINYYRLRLKNLQSRYTDRHPEIQRLKKIIREFTETGDPQADRQGDGEAPLYDPQLLELKRQAQEVEFNINRLKEERQVLGRQIEKYEKWIAAAPVREAEWSALTRDYEQLNEYYQNLVTQNLQAASAQSLEHQLRGSQFKIIDAAHLPEKPFNPDFTKLILMALFAGFAAGGGLALGFELLGTSFKDPADLEKYLNLPVVCAVPMLYTSRELTRKRAVNLAWNMAFILILALIIGITTYFWQQGMIIL